MFGTRVVAPDSELFNLVPVYQREVLQVSDQIPHTHSAMTEVTSCIEKLFVSTETPVL